MKVLVLGATGFIGGPVAAAFVRNGHEVYGQTRSQEKAKQLAADEIIPVVAEPADVSAWVDVAGKVDVVIEALGGSDLFDVGVAALEAVAATAKKVRGDKAPKLTYIYCSGTWVYGEDRINATSERTPPQDTTELVSWRTTLEQKVLTIPNLEGIVIRGAVLYGRSASILHYLFAQAGAGKTIEWCAHPGGRWALVHQDDLADLFLRVAEAAPICKGPIFDGVNEQSESVEDVLQKLVEVSGSVGYKLREPKNIFEDAIATTMTLRPSLGRALVRWRPLKPSLVDGMKVYYAAWQAGEEKVSWYLQMNSSRQ